MFTPTLAFNFGPIEIGAILLLGILLFGRKLPEIGKNVGKTIVEFKKGLNSAHHDIADAAQEPQLPEAKPPVSARTTPRQVKQIATGDEP